MMLQNDILNVVKDQNASFQEDPNEIQREKLKTIHISNSFALIISGIRRAGKSTFLHQIRKKNKLTAYFNFEDTRLSDFEVSDFEKLDIAFKVVFGNIDVYFFDEIQNISKWEIYVRQLLDKNKKVVITGSNASMLSKELGTRLTGRYLKIEMFPFSYEEYLFFKREKPGNNSFERYLLEGGFPEYLKLEKEEVLQELLRNILERDIVVRHKLKTSKTLKDLSLYLLSNVGKEYSYNNLKKMLDIGSINTIISFVSYLEDSYLFFNVNRFDFSPKKQLVSPKKVYCIDNGMIKANSLSFSKDEGRLFENLVFISLRQIYNQIYYYKENGSECDFIVKEKDKVTLAVQATIELTSDNKDREINGLLAAMKKLKLINGLIVTKNQEDKIVKDGFRIDVVPLRKWNLK